MGWSFLVEVEDLEKNTMCKEDANFDISISQVFLSLIGFSMFAFTLDICFYFKNTVNIRLYNVEAERQDWHPGYISI